MGTILSKRHFLANFDKQAIAVTEFTDFLSIYAMPRLGELLVATSLVLTASQEVNGTEDGWQNGKGWKRDMVSVEYHAFHRSLKRRYCIPAVYIPGLIMMEREGEPAWRFWQWRSLGHIYIYGTGPGPAGPPPPWYGPKTCVLQHSAWKRWIWSVFCTVGGWRGPQTCKFVGFLQPAFRKRVLCNVSASTSWGSAVAPPSMSSCHIIPNLLI